LLGAFSVQLLFTFVVCLIAKAVINVVIASKSTHRAGFDNQQAGVPLG